LRLAHLSDIHLWRIPRNPLELLGKRLVGVTELVCGRARRFELERLPGLVDRVLSLACDHVLITGDLTTLATAPEFEAARRQLDPLLADPARATVIPGNHDRYTRSATRHRLFEQYFGAFAPAADYPWIRRLGNSSLILGLDPTRPALTAQGVLPADQLARARALTVGLEQSARLLVACHYPAAAPREFAHKLAFKGLHHLAPITNWLAELGPHLYLCGHLHTSWAFRPEIMPQQLSLNPGAALMKSRTGRNPPGFFEILLEDEDVTVIRHAFRDGAWESWLFHREAGFFAAAPARTQLSGS